MVQLRQNALLPLQLLHVSAGELLLVDLQENPEGFASWSHAPLAIALRLQTTSFQQLVELLG